MHRLCCKKNWAIRVDDVEVHELRNHRSAFISREDKSLAFRNLMIADATPYSNNKHINQSMLHAMQIPINYSHAMLQTSSNFYVSRLPPPLPLRFLHLLHNRLIPPMHTLRQDLQRLLHPLDIIRQTLLLHRLQDITRHSRQCQRRISED